MNYYLIGGIAGVIIIGIIIVLILWKTGILGDAPSEEEEEELIDTDVDFDLVAPIDPTTAPPSLPPLEAEIAPPQPMESVDKIESKPTPLRPATGESWFKPPAKVPNPVIYPLWKRDPRARLLNNTWLGNWVKTPSVKSVRDKCIANAKCKGVYGTYYRDANDFAKPQFRMMSRTGSINPKSRIPDNVYTKYSINYGGRWTYLPRVWKYGKQVIPTGHKFLGDWARSGAPIIAAQSRCESNPDCRGVYVGFYRLADGTPKKQYRLMSNVGKPSGKLMPKLVRHMGVWTYLERK